MTEPLDQLPNAGQSETHRIARPRLDPLVVRERFNTVTAAAGSILPWPEAMAESQHWARSLDGTQLEVRRFVPAAVAQGQSSPNRAVIYAFGGGMVGGSIDVFKNFMATLAELSGTQVFAPQYRLAPENPYPAGVEDMYATILWLQANAESFNVDPRRIVVFGQSAGGGIAAAAALMARDKKLNPPLAAQCFRYAMLDDQTTLNPDSPRVSFINWTAESNMSIWQTYLYGEDNGKQRDEVVSYYAAPARAEHLSGLPPSHIGVGDYDLFRNECLKYAYNLGIGGVAIELHVYPGVPHGFDGDPSIALGKEMWQNEARFIQKF